MYEALSYECMRHTSFSSSDFDQYRQMRYLVLLLVYEALRYQCTRPSATSVCGLQLLVYEALSY